MSVLLEHLESMSSERKQYTLEAFAQHMHYAGEYEKLDILFDNDEWMKVRFEGSNYTYDGFLADLEIAWADLEKIEDEAPSIFVMRFPRYVRLGMIGSSITSLSQIPTNLLISAASTKCWSIDRVLALVSRYSSAERVIVYTGLLILDNLELTERRKVQQQIYEMVIARSNKIPVRHLTALLPYLEHDLAGEIIDRIVDTISVVTEFTPTFRQISPRRYEDERFYLDEAINLLHLLPITRRAKVVQVVSEGILREVRYAIAFRNAENKPEHEEKLSNLSELMQQYHLHIMEKELEDLSPYALYLEQLVPFLEDYPMINELLNQLVDTLEIVGDAEFFKQVVCVYAPYFNRDQMAKVLQDTMNLDASKIQEVILSSLAPHVDSTLVRYLLDISSSFAGTEKHSFILSILAQQEAKVTNEQVESSGDSSDSPLAEVDLSEDQRNLLTHISEANQGSENKERPSSLFERIGRGLLESFVPRESYIADPEEPLKHTHSAKFRQISPRDEEQKGYVYIGPSLGEMRNEWIHSIMSYFNDEPSQIGLPISNTPLGESRHDDTQQKDLANNNDLLSEHIFKVGAPAFLIPLASRLPNDVLSTLVDEYFDANEMAFQVYLLDYLATKESDAERAAEYQVSIARIKGAMLKSALNYTYQHNDPIANAWSTLPEALPSEADLSILLDFVLALPAELERNEFRDIFFGEDAHSNDESPRLQALALFISNLKGDLLLKTFRNVLTISDITIRKLGLDMLAPYLSREEITKALEVTLEIPDSLEQSWALSVLSAAIKDERRDQVAKREIDAALQVANGRHLGVLLAGLLKRDENDQLSTETLEYILNTISHRGPNYRLDALESLVRHWQGPVPEPLLDAVLALPTVSERSLYSWRGKAIVLLVDCFPKESIARIWQAAQELPRRLNIGDAEAWGWNWDYEYPYASAIYTLAPGLSGELLDQAFEEAKTFYWKPREEIFQRLASNAGSNLAGKILDFTLMMVEKYATTTLSTESLSEQEGAVVLGSLVKFKIEREVDCAEIISALAPNLDEICLEKAAEKVRLFHTNGPSAWLTGKLAPYLPETTLRRILPLATIDALDFIGYDPTRFDLLTELLPHIKRFIEAEARPIKELLSKYFPERENLLLTPEERELLPEEDRKMYEQLVEKHIPIQVKKRILGEAAELSEQEQRKVAEESILTPFMGNQLDQVALHLLLKSPLSKRLEAFPSLVTSLSEEQMTLVATHTFEEILQVEPRNEEKLVEMLDSIIPYLPKALHTKVIEVALRLADTRKLTEEDLAETIYGKVLQDFARRLAPMFKHESYNPIMSYLERKWNLDYLQKSFGKLMSNRVRLLESLLPHLDPHLLAQIVNAILQLSEIERVHGIYTLMPHINGDLKSQVYENILTMHSAFGRTYILWMGLDHLDEAQRQQALPIAISAAQSLRSEIHQAVALLTLIGLNCDSEQYVSMLKLALKKITSLANEGDALRVLAIFTKMAASFPDLMEDVLKFILRFKDGTFQMKGLILLSRDDDPQFQEITTKYAQSICAAVARRLRNSANSERRIYLTELANLLPTCQSFIDDKSKYLIAETINEICRQWHWL